MLRYQWWILVLVVASVGLALLYREIIILTIACVFDSCA